MKNFVLIIGFGKSGKWAYNLALKLGYMPLIFDDAFMSLENCWLDFDVLDFAVVSPGVPPHHKLLQLLREKGIKVISEIEFCYLAREDKTPIIGVTGTNGKTTVVEMISAVLKENAIVAGNIGKTWSEAITKNEKAKYTVLELSSFQLDNVNLFSPSIAVITNLAPDHIDYHGSYQNYIDAKMNVLKNMRQGDCVVYNGEDEEVRERVRSVYKPRILYFSEEKLNGEGIYIDEKKNIVLCLGGKERVLFSLPVDRHFEKHIKLNILASALVCVLLGVDAEQIELSLINFKPSVFRQEKIENSLGIKIINDSKATNLSAVLMALFEHKPDVLLVGGRGKVEDYSKLFIKPSFHHLVVYGEMGKEISDCAKSVGFHNFVYYEKFDEAVEMSVKLANVGETLLFSPAGSSFDQFSSYKERGARFNFLIKSMETKNS